MQKANEKQPVATVGLIRIYSISPAKLWAWSIYLQGRAEYFLLPGAVTFITATGKFPTTPPIFAFYMGRYGIYDFTYDRVGP